MVAEVIRKAPLTDEKVAFAWRLAVGPAIAKATTVRLDADGTLYVTAESQAWLDSHPRVGWLDPIDDSPTILATTPIKRISYSDP